MEPKPGLVVAGNVRLSKLLGKGGMGSVWVADHLGLDTEVAVKFVDPQATKNPAVLARFKREAGIAAKLKNPHAVQTFDHGILPDGTPYIVMELLEGESLHEKLARERTLSLRETTLVVMQTAQVLAKAHKMGIVHRDLKPANLFLIDTGYELFVKLLDFGIAKHATGITEVGLTKTGSLLGSPLYMSPEQFVNVKGVDHRGDLWSLAVVAYQCMSGTYAFKGETLGQVILAVTSCDYQPITEMRKGLAPALDAFFERAFVREIDKRFQSAKEMADAFAAAAQSAEQAGSPDATGPRASLPSITDLSLGTAPEAGVPHGPAPSSGHVSPEAGAARASTPSSGNAPLEATAELPAEMQLGLAAASAPSRHEPAAAEQAQTFSPAATTLNQEPTNKRGVMVAAILAAVAAAGVAGVVVMSGATGDSPGAEPTAQEADAEAGSAAASQRVAEAEPEPTSDPSAAAVSSADAALAEGPNAAATGAASASAGAGAGAVPGATVAAPMPTVVHTPSRPAGKQPSVTPKSKPTPKGYDKGMGF